MLDLWEQLRTCQELALNNAKDAQTKAKVWYNRKREKGRLTGQIVLVLLSVPGKALHAKYQGPFKISGKRGPLD